MTPETINAIARLANNDDFLSFVKDIKDRRDRMALDGVDIKDQIDRLRNDGRVQELKFIIKQIEDARGNAEAIRKLKESNPGFV